MTNTSSHFRPLSPSQANARSWKPYPAYKPSGVEWLGDVPEHWGVKRLKTSATCWVSNVDKVPAEDEMPVRLCNYTNVYYNDHITPDMGLMETTATANEIRRFGLSVGDVVITKDSESWNDIAVPALVKQSAPDMVCGYHLAIIRSHANKLCGDYLHRAFQACAVNQQFQIVASGVTRYGLPKASIGDAWIPLPAPAEQTAIADFLDRETGKIDRLVAKKRELIGKLKEERAALISRTVTRGLNPDAKLKPSGVEWLGDVPEHWEVKRLGYLFWNLDYRRIPVAAEDRATIDKTYPYYGASGIIDYVDDYLFDETLILVAEDGANLLSRSTPLAFLAAGKYWVNNHAHILKPLGGDIRYWAGSLQAFDFTPLVTGAAQPKLTAERLGSIRLPKPPDDEQRAIADFLDSETGKIDRLAAKVEEAIGRLQEYRAALITAAVTGKVDVREAAAAGEALEYPAAESGLLKAAEAGGAYGGKSTGKKGTERENTDTHRPARTDTKAVGTQTDTRKALAADHGGPCASVPVRVPPGETT